MMLGEASKRVLADRLSALLASRPDRTRMEHAAAMGLSDGTLGRIKYGTGNPTVEVLDHIAAYFRLQTWQLLKPDDAGAQVAEPVSQPVSGEQLTIAADIVDEALRGLWLPKHQYYELVALAFEGITQGLPYAQILEFISPAARKFTKTEVGNDSAAGLGGASARGDGKRKAAGNG